MPDEAAVSQTNDTAVPDAAVLDALPFAVLVVDCHGVIRRVNAAAEQLFAASRSGLTGIALDRLLPADSPIHGLIAQARAHGQSVAQDEVDLDAPRIPLRRATGTAAPVGERAADVVLTLRERTMARKLDRQLVHRSAARSVSGMAALLAHEVKNPLSGIRGAAQLLEQTAREGDRRLTAMIREEADRVVALLDEMEVFADDRPIDRGPVNIHEVLDHVEAVAEAGVARTVSVNKHYDPSLPPVLGNRNLLVQVFLNLIKNAAEAVAGTEGRIDLVTRYHHGVRLAVPGGDAAVDLPLVVTVRDNGPGIPADLREHLFDPFVTTKTGGRGLGLALVAKVVGDHGGVIEHDTDARGTTFRVFLPIVREAVS